MDLEAGWKNITARVNLRHSSANGSSFPGLRIYWDVIKFGGKEAGPMTAPLMRWESFPQVN